MNTIQCGKGWVEINGDPSPKGEHLRIAQWGGYAEIEIKDRITGDTLLQRCPYDQLRVPGTPSLPFSSAADLKTYIHENFFFN